VNEYPVGRQPVVKRGNGLPKPRIALGFRVAETERGEAFRRFRIQRQQIPQFQRFAVGAAQRIRRRELVLGEIAFESERSDFDDRSLPLPIRSSS